MPIYEYKCDKCKKVFEVLFISMNEVREVFCPECKSKKTHKLMSMFGGRVGDTPLAGSSSDCGTCNSTSCSTT
ncbi:MAG: zinc ribbon domain-containing protein [Deltaproteobacteria bacterium]|nr:zinc ribbon domain-containing protein [Deltaproteobacteria bacterium]